MVDYGISVTSIERFYVEGPWHDVIILNEYDLIVNHSPYQVQQNVIKGIWQLCGHKVIAFSATSSSGYERFVHNCITPPAVLKFKSEYELVHATSPVADPTIRSCTDLTHVMSTLLKDLDKCYEQQPIVLIIAPE